MCQTDNRAANLSILLPLELSDTPYEKAAKAPGIVRSEVE
jgi:hypothetical protein